MVWQPEHAPTGPVCKRCGLPAGKHRKRANRAEYFQRRERNRVRPSRQDHIIGIDGEGQGRRPCNECATSGLLASDCRHSTHRYTFMAAADEFGRKWRMGLTNRSGALSTEQCLDFILSLPERTLIFGYGFLYDLTKALTDVDDNNLYLLSHENKRLKKLPNGRIVPRPLFWEGPSGATYKLNFMNRCFTVTKGKRSNTVWDIIRFFQSPFIAALIDWKIAGKERLTRMAEMKDKRAIFDQLAPDEVEDYCVEECLYLAKLGRGLVDAHKDAGLPLKKYHGAGSTASVLLDKMGIKEKRGETPHAMKHAVACAFFGGRFENSRVGPVMETVYNYDISSAYPYQAYLLPCLEHGTWRYVRRNLDTAIEKAALALIHWRIPAIAHDEQWAWGPFPVRTSEGTIAFPISGKGGWTWKQEFLAGRELQPNAEATEAWTYETDCSCRPFKLLPEIYKERLRIGKESKGIVLKLGPNSVYGKLAQSKGLNPPYRQWVWAGNITSGCRAQLLGCFPGLQNPWSILSFATDGIQSLQPLALATPADTGTYGAKKPGETKCLPLGGWEEKKYEKGMFYVRPGIYFPLAPSDDELKDVRARGLGKKVLYNVWGWILDEWWSGNRTSLEISGPSRFVGMKSGLTYGKKSGVTRSPDYGEWIDWPIKVSFAPMPKRRSTLPDCRLAPHVWLPWESEPYKAAKEDPETKALMWNELIMSEQPDLSFGDMQ